MISIWGTFQGTSGYAKHTSNLALEVAKLTDVRLHSTNGLPVPLSQYNNDTIADNLVCISIPPYWDIFSGSRTNFNGFLVFQGDRLPDYWVDIINKDYVKRILVPSTHVESLAKKVTTKEIVIIPHGYNPKIFYPAPIKHDTFTYGFVGGWSQGKTDRKGFDILLETFCDTFTNNDNVCLRAKLNTEQPHPRLSY
jgi:glycosyltransferase involved in cell wall biosynthesis